MQKALAIKLLVIGVIAFVLLIPLGLIADKIYERNQYLQSAKDSVAQSWTGAQELMGPILVIPYIATDYVDVWNKDGSLKQKKEVIKQKQVFINPETLIIKSQVENDIRYKGIYKVPVYTADFDVSGTFDVQRIQDQLRDIQASADKVELLPAYLFSTVSDPRGINSIPSLQWLNQAIKFMPGSMFERNEEGIHAFVPDFTNNTLSALGFSYQVTLRGMESLSFIPTGIESQVSVASDWPHPEFTGKFLPVQHSISEDGYSATWKTTSFANNISEKVVGCAKGECSGLLFSGFGTKHIETVDVYQQSDRALKYGILFIGLTFISFFIFEVVKRLPIHAIQYTLVGFANAIFYLLLVSLSEHLAFGLSYAIASVACIALLMFYLSYVLKGVKLSLLYSGLLSVLYLCLYMIISSEDLAFLMGSLLTFVILIVVMVATRNIDWYDVGDRASAVSFASKGEKVE
ncbi:cell envelope integrity protein CreD [Litoribrevibacter albus]|uniref:Cell envelope integrity protein CreD n=1 Tax=Litoribrevibacter albus TaxID=1473156 RepID=A0AA37W851_9GAMM|nr:cell envelope integrity protein CreD [Litoribrevibacter albus]GLQ33357.1 cell envelope integrity protein CreD [Litoribrevibacter albus]